MAFELLMRDCAAEEDRRSKRDELMQREEKRLSATALFEARIGDYDRLVTIPRQSRGHSGCEPLKAAVRGR